MVNPLQVEHTVSPAHSTASLTVSRDHALAAIKDARTDTTLVSQTLRGFLLEVFNISSTARMDPRLIDSLIYSVSYVWAASDAALEYSQLRWPCRQDAEDCMTQMLPRLHPFLPHLTAHQANGILQSLSVFAMPASPDVQALTAKLTQQVAANASDAHDVTAAVSALTQWKRKVDDLHVNTAAMQALCERFAFIINSSFHSRPITSGILLQALSNLASLKVRPSPAVLDSFCAYLVSLVQTPLTSFISAQTIAVTLKACLDLRYLPQPEHSWHLLKWFANLCTMSPHQQPSPEDHRVVIMTAAMLGLAEVFQIVQYLGLQVVNTANVAKPTLCSVLWSMSVANILDIATFTLFLDTLSTQSSEGALQDSDIRRVHQALFRLQPFDHDSQEVHQAWNKASQRVQQMGSVLPRAFNTQTTMLRAFHNALSSLQLVYTRDVQLSGYMADAVLDRKSADSGPVLVAVLHPLDRVRYQPDRFASRDCRLSRI